MTVRFKAPVVLPWLHDPRVMVPQGGPGWGVALPIPMQVCPSTLCGGARERAAQFSSSKNREDGAAHRIHSPRRSWAAPGHHPRAIHKRHTPAPLPCPQAVEDCTLLVCHPAGDCGTGGYLAEGGKNQESDGKEGQDDSRLRALLQGLSGNLSGTPGAAGHGDAPGRGARLVRTRPLKLQGCL